MRPRHIGTWLLRRWPLVGGALLIAAIIVALALSLTGSRGILAQAEPTPFILTEETLHLLPPFDFNLVPTVVPPPCVERYREKYRPYRYIKLQWGSYNANGCTLTGPSGRGITEAEADALVAKRGRSDSIESGNQTRDTFVDPRTLAREIFLRDGSKIKLPSDVRIVEVESAIRINCPRRNCRKPPFYKLQNGDSVIWIDSKGVGFEFHFDDDEINPDAFPFITEVE